jgi:small subunit ribosomal protein S2e
MADRGGFGGGFGGGKGKGRGKGKGKGKGKGRSRGRGGDEKKAWVPVTKLGRLVQAGKINRLEDIFLFSLPVKEYQIIDYFLDEKTLKDEVMKICPVQKQTRAGQRTRMKAIVVVGDNNGHIGLGVKCAKEVATSIRAAIILAKLSLIPIRLGHWGSKFGKPHTVPCKVTGKCGSVRFRLIPAPRGTGIVAANCTKKVLQMAGVTDVYTSACGTTRTLGNFVKACLAALVKTTSYLTPDQWESSEFSESPYQQHTDFLKNAGEKYAK